MMMTAGLTENSQATGQTAALASGSSNKSRSEQIYHHLISKPEEDATYKEMQVVLALNPSTQRPRRGVLFSKGKFADGRRARVTRSGRRAVVGDGYEGAR